MFRSLVGMSLIAAATINLSAKEHDYKLNFEDIQFQAFERNVRHLVSTKQKSADTFAYVRGKVKLSEGISGHALDFSDTRSRTEFSLKTANYYDRNSGTISFMLAPTKKNFGVEEESVIFEENNGKTYFGLYVDAAGMLKLKVTARSLVKNKVTVDVSKYNEEYLKDPVPGKAPNYDDTSFIYKQVEAAEEKTQNELEALESAFKIKSYEFQSFESGNTSNWPVNHFQHILVAWDLRKGLFVVLVNGKYAIRSLDPDQKDSGLFFDRGQAGKYIIFGKGHDGFSAKIDNLVVSKLVKDQEFDLPAMKEVALD